MKLEPPLSIAPSKLVNYLLVPLPSDDKSNYLGLADYTLANWPVLERDLLTLAKTTEAVYEGTSVFGDSFSVTGTLTGPNGRSLAVKTIWMKEVKSGSTKFVTLYPPR